MTEKTYCVLILRHRENNTYGERALNAAKLALRGPGVVGLNSHTYLVAIPDGIGALLGAAAVEIRSMDKVRNLHFAIIPCGSHVYGELEEQEVKALGALGLSYSETPFPAPLS